ncbi:MAG TPA: DNA polymerase III subunit gamma/tau [Acidimicrobiales bacterium]|nr:DNA polymerase III subunit gamma/tau [Acidimicrobiales bacterium]
MSDVPPEPSPDPSSDGASEADATEGTPEDAPYQSLYRRYRPARFEEVRGQDHVVLALRNAVRDDRVAHAYLFSGPRGTGKTSTARILAKALNCTNLTDGEPCGVCPSCVEIAKGTSLDVHELDAASNNGVEAMRDLVSRAALGTPGRQKVYIVDEVHMLSTAASNALLKTLEEPPAHVVFVLATTDPQKVLPTIRSRTQHFEFRLLDADTLGELLTQVRNDAQLDVTDEGLDIALRRGKGSARDALSVLDQVAASDNMEDDLPELSEIAEALAERDTGRALVAVAHLTSAGWSPQQLAGDLVEHLRQAFLTMVAPELVLVGDTERDEITGLGKRLGLAALVRGMEVLGLAQVAMREAPDPRVNLEVALVRLAHPDVDTSPEALVARIERLERDGGAPAVPSAAAASPPGAAAASPTARSSTDAGSSPTAALPHPSSPEPPVDPAGSAPSAGGRKTLGAIRRQAGGSASRGPAPEQGPPAAPSGSRAAAPGPRGTEHGAPPSGDPASSASAASAPSAGSRPAASPATSSPAGASAPQGSPMPTRDELVEAWGDHVLGRLRPKAKALFQAGRFVSVEGDKARFGLPNETHRMRCEEVRADVEAILSDHFGRRVPLVLVVDDSSGGQAAPESFAPSSGSGNGSGAGVPSADSPQPSGFSAPGSSSSGSSVPGSSSSGAGSSYGSSSPVSGSSPRSGSSSGSGSSPGSGSGSPEVAPGSSASASGSPASVPGSRGSSEPFDRSAPVDDDDFDDQDFSAFAEAEEVTGVDNSPTARVLQAFPGAEEVT